MEWQEPVVRDRSQLTASRKEDILQEQIEEVREAEGKGSQTGTLPEGGSQSPRAEEGTEGLMCLHSFVV